jgi:hypothetical protein
MLLLRTVRTVELKTGQSRQWDWGGFVFVRGWLQLQTCSSGLVMGRGLANLSSCRWSSSVSIGPRGPTRNARFQEAHQPPTFGPCR